MKTLLLKLKQKSGLLTELQSDTIYGHFCWRLKERLGEGKLVEFISSYKNDKPVFLISDGLLSVDEEIHFPRPFIFNKPELKEKKADKVIEFVKRKKNKERNYLYTSELNSFLSNGAVKLEEKKVETSKKKKQKTDIPLRTESLRVSVQIDRNSFGSSEGKLFSFNPKYTRDDVSYVLLIKVLDENSFKLFECESILKEVFSIGFGRKKSSGYGQFELLGFEEFSEITEPNDANAFMVLGNYLPSDLDNIIAVGYDIDTKYGKLGEDLSQSENPFKNPIVFLKSGSCFRTSSKKDSFGRVTNEGEISAANKFVVQFGMPFIYGIKL
jgi:CRISPR-associated protein Csm4